MIFFFFFSSRRRHTRCSRDWSSDVCSSDLDSELAETGHPSCVATVHVLLGIEVLDLAGDVDGIGGVVERREDADAGFTGEAARPELLDGVADRGDSPHA